MCRIWRHRRLTIFSDVNDAWLAGTRLVCACVSGAALGDTGAAMSTAGVHSYRQPARRSLQATEPPRPRALRPASTHTGSGTAGRARPHHCAAMRAKGAPFPGPPAIRRMIPADPRETPRGNERRKSGRAARANHGGGAARTRTVGPCRGFATASAQAASRTRRPGGRLRLRLRRRRRRAMRARTLPSATRSRLVASAPAHAQAGGGGGLHAGTRLRPCQGGGGGNNTRLALIPKGKKAGVLCRGRE